MTSLRDLMNVAVEAAQAGGKSTLAHFNTNLEIERKSDSTPVTVADRNAEKIIREILVKHFPSHSILGEEFGRVEGDPDFTWVIDPIDGTKSFIHGVPLFGSIVGCLIKGEPKVGAVYLPALDQLFCAAEGLGATWNGQSCRVSNIDKLSDATMLCSTIMRAIKRSDAFENLDQHVNLTRGWGDVFGYMLLARGQAHIMLDPFISLWDIAGVAPIIREAGGVVGNWKGESTVNGPDCVAVVPGLKDAVLDELKHEKRK